MMSERLQIPAYVKAANDKYVIVNTDDAPKKKALMERGFEEHKNGDFHRMVENAEKKALVLEDLRDLGFAFSVGPGWSPSEVFEDLRDRNLLQGCYKRLSWTGPKQFHITEDC
jgi:hypothetical protein